VLLSVASGFATVLTGPPEPWVTTERVIVLLERSINAPGRLDGGLLRTVERSGGVRALQCRHRPVSASPGVGHEPRTPGHWSAQRLAAAHAASERCSSPARLSRWLRWFSCCAWA